MIRRRWPWMLADWLCCSRAGCGRFEAGMRRGSCRHRFASGAACSGAWTRFNAGWKRAHRTAMSGTIAGTQLEPNPNEKWLARVNRPAIKGKLLVVIVETNPLADHWTPAPFSLTTLNEMEADAAMAPGHRGQLLRLAIAYERTIAAAHRAEVYGDAEARSAAILDRCQAAGRIDAAQDAIADDWLSGLSLARDRRPEEIRDLLLSALATMLAPLYRDVLAIADAVASLEAGAR